MKNPKFQMYLGKDSLVYFRLLAKNGEIILNSEGYSSRRGCRKGIESVKKNAPVVKRYKLQVSRKGEDFFALSATNGRVIGMSEMYSSVQRRNNGIQAVKKTASSSPVEDLT